MFTVLHMTVTTNETGQTNVFAKEPQVEFADPKELNPIAEKGEQLNGRLAMLGFLAAMGAYITTGQIIPGLF